MARVYYYEDDPLKTFESLARYEFARQYVAGKGIVLDVGCGARKGPYIIAQSANVAIGSDISNKALSYCADKWRAQNLRYVACDAVALPFNDCVFDVVSAFEVLEHILDQESFIKGLRRVLKKDGVCILSTPNRCVMSPEGVPQNSDHVKEFSVVELKEFLSGIFSKVDIYGQKPSERAEGVLLCRRQSYQNISRVSVFLRHMLPKSIRAYLFGIYVLLFSKKQKKPLETDISEVDFKIKEVDIESAHYLVAVCMK